MINDVQKCPFISCITFTFIVVDDDDYDDYDDYDDDDDDDDGILYLPADESESELLKTFVYVLFP